MTTRAPATTRRLGAYQLLTQLGRGGMGEVWRAEHLRLGRQAAVKLIRPRDPGEAGEHGNVVRRRFEREARATASLTSAHTVSLYDFGVAPDGTFYYAMELLEGLDLEALVEKHGPQPPARVVHLLAQACDSLGEAHARGLLHRDIKPSNLFVCRRGLEHDFVKVLDFGLVKAISGEDDVRHTLTGEHRRVGTPAFMAPEAARGGLSVDARADLYALGCVAYYLLTASNVFTGETALELMLRHADDPVVPPSVRTHFELPADVEAVVMACLAKSPDDRPASASALKAALLACGVAPLWTMERAEQWWLGREPQTLPREPVLLPVPDPTRATLDEWARTRVDGLALSVDSTLVDVEPVVATNLPAELTSFVGRADDLAAVQSSLLRGARLVTLHGPGGVGKSRVALRFGGQAASDYLGGVWYADLAEARAAEDVVEGVAEALGIVLTTGEPEERLTRALAARAETLVVLDNVEHVREEVGRFVSEWLGAAPRLRVVATSREPLHVAGEYVLPVEPFEPPLAGAGPSEAAGLRDNAAVALFVERARATDPAFALDDENAAEVAELVRQLDGLPLAIELAAARLRVLTPSQIAERVADRLDVLRSEHANAPARQTTLQATLDWSWQLLRDWERAALAQAALFHGGFPLEAAEAVLDLSDFGGARPVAEVLGALLDKSLLRRVVLSGEDAPIRRFAMLSSVQSYARARWRADEGEAGGRLLRGAAQRHGRYYATYGDEPFLRALHGNTGGRRLAELGRERENLRAALAAAFEHADEVTAAGAGRALLALAAARGPMAAVIDAVRPVLDLPRLPAAERLALLTELGTACRYAGRLEEARTFLDRAIDLSARSGTPDAQARALGSRATLVVESGDYEGGRRELTKALALARSARDAYTEAQGVMRLAVMDELAGKRAAAEAGFVEARALARAIGARDIEGVVLVNLGELHLERGELEAAQVCFQDALEAHRDVGSLRAESYALRGLGDIELVLERYEQAERHFRESLAIARTVGVLAQEATVLLALAEIYRRCDRPDLALGAGEQALALVRDHGLRRDEGPTAAELALSCIALGQLERATELAEQASQLLTPETPPVERAVLLCVQAELAVAQGDLAAAREALEEAEALSDVVGIGRRSRVGYYLAGVRERLEEAES